MSKIRSSIACNLNKNILLASLPLFQTEKVEAIEWSFDTLFRTRNIPSWFVQLLEEYSAADRLIGHGVFFSLFSGRWTKEQERWLNHLQKVASHFNFQHITEHFGFMTGKNFHHGAPISIPFNQTTLAIGQDRLKRIYQVCKCPVGLENLAFSYSLEEVKKHGEFLAQLVDPVNGFIILDLHNLYCQLHNFQVDFEQIIQLYPLDLVREIHISGGSWEDSAWLTDRKVRRDTHDDSVPEEVFNLLKQTIKTCPNLKFVVLEQLGSGLEEEEDRIQFQRDFHRMHKIVEQQNQVSLAHLANDFLPKENILPGAPIQNEELFHQQNELSDILETANGYEEAKAMLLKSTLAGTSWGVEKWEPFMLDTVVQIAQKWKIES